MNIGYENEFTEFKETLSEKEDAMKDMCAILNKRGKGTLYFGVKDNGEIVGLQIGKKTESDLADKINSSIEPAPFYSIETKEDILKHKFIEVTFHGENKPYRAKGAYFIRNGERSDQMSTALLCEMLTQSLSTYDEWENSSSGITLDMIDESLVKKVVQTGNDLNRMDYSYAGVEDALRFFHLINAEGHINNAGEALFSKNRPIGCRLSLLGDLKGTVFLDMQRRGGNIFELIDASIEYVMSKLNYKTEANPFGIQRLTEEEIPMIAIRELVVNAFGHAFYAAPFTHDVAVYPNRVAVFNPGPFPSLGRPEDFAAKKLKPIDKNERINNILYFGNYIEHFGTGFTKAFELFKERKITYRYRNLNGGFIFEVFRPGRVFLSDPNGSDYQKVLEILTQDSYASLDQISQLVGKSRATVSRVLASLKENDKIERLGGDKKGRWAVKQWISTL